jgi:hypothetical protein
MIYSPFSSFFFINPSYPCSNAVCYFFDNFQKLQKPNHCLYANNLQRQLYANQWDNDAIL